MSVPKQSGVDSAPSREADGNKFIHESTYTNPSITVCPSVRVSISPRPLNLLLFCFFSLSLLYLGADAVAVGHCHRAGLGTGVRGSRSGQGPALVADSRKALQRGRRRAGTKHWHGGGVDGWDKREGRGGKEKGRRRTRRQQKIVGLKKKRGGAELGVVATRQCSTMCKRANDFIVLHPCIFHTRSQARFCGHASHCHVAKTGCKLYRDKLFCFRVIF